METTKPFMCSSIRIPALMLLLVAKSVCMLLLFDIVVKEVFTSLTEVIASGILLQILYCGKVITLLFVKVG